MTELMESFSTTWYQLGTLSLLLNHTTAKTCLENALKYNSRHQPTIQDLSNLLIKTNDVKAIPNLIELIENSFKFQELSSDMNYILSFLNFKIGKINEAMKYFEHLQNSKNPEHWYLKSLIFPNEFLKSINHALDLNPSNDLKFDIYLALANYYKDKDIGKSIEIIKDGLQLPYNQNYYTIFYFKLILFYLISGNINEAYFYSNQSLIVIQKNYKLLIIHSCILILLHENNLASDILNNLINYNESIVDHTPWFLLSLTTDLQKNSFTYLETSLKKNPSSAATWLLIGSLYLNLNQLPDALAAYSQALRLGDDFVGGLGWDGLSCVYERCDNQLMDASDACARSATCFQTLGPRYEEICQRLLARSQILSTSAKENTTIVVRDPIEMPIELVLTLIKDLDNDQVELNSTQPKVEAIQPDQLVGQPPIIQVSQTHSLGMAHSQSPPQSNDSPNQPVQPSGSVPIKQVIETPAQRLGPIVTTPSQQTGQQQSPVPSQIPQQSPQQPTPQSQSSVPVIQAQHVAPVQSVQPNQPGQFHGPQGQNGLGIMNSTPVTLQGTPQQHPPPLNSNQLTPRQSPGQYYYHLPTYQLPPGVPMPPPGTQPPTNQLPPQSLYPQHFPPGVQPMSGPMPMAPPGQMYPGQLPVQPPVGFPPPGISYVPYPMHGSPPHQKSPMYWRP